MAWPLVSVIIPVYNRASTVGRAVESVLRQTYRPLEVIVVDDGSTDGTAESLAAYGDKIILIRQPNGGPSSARNTGVRHSKGIFIAFLDSDDTWEPAKLEFQVRLLILGGEKVPCCVCNARNIVGGESIETSFEIAGVGSGLAEGYWLNPADLIASRFLLFNQVVAIRRAAFEKVGGFKESMRVLEDHDLAFRLSLLGPWAFISEPMVTKYDEADGIGVQARQDAGFHAAAWKMALEGFLVEKLDGRDSVELQVRRGLEDVTLSIRALAMGDCAVSRILMFLLRIKCAIRRRLPSWPKPDAVATLEPGNTGIEVMAESV
jgi:glycosyltransferase involved in cell wall biosynthesis